MNSTAWAGVCSEVKIEIKQQLTLERQAFEATMTINNGLTVPLTSIGVDVNFADKDGNAIPATSDTSQVENPDNPGFFIRILSMTNVDSVDGQGSIISGQEAVIKWLIIPTKNSGGSDPNGQEYKVGAALQYNDGSGDKTIDVIPDSIFVYPMPDLVIDYFLPQYVYGDDPFTGFVEAPEPFHLGFRVLNIGHGPAKNLKLKTDQPRIVENELGLLAGFEITGSEVNGQEATNSLIADIGDVAPGGTGIVNWIMESTLSGEFDDFTASFTHDDDLGGELTSLIAKENLRTHTLVREVLVDRPGSDQLKDFLALDGNTFNLYASDGVDAQVTESLPAAQSYSGSSQTVTRSRLAGNGYAYIKYLLNGDDQELDNLEIKSAIRNDGKSLNKCNAWISKRKTNDTDWEFFVHVFDFEDTTTGGDVSYTLSFGAKPIEIKPVLAEIADKVVLVDQFVGIEVQSSVQGSSQVANLSMKSLLATDATFEELGDGRGRFEWTPDKVGAYDFTIYASHAGKVVNRTFRIAVVDGSLPNVNFEVAEISVNEKDAELKAYAVLSVPYHEQVSVDFDHVDGTALGSGLDFNMTDSTTLTFDPGETRKSVNIVINDDEEQEGLEEFEIVLSNVVNGFSGSTNRMTVEIIDDDLNNNFLIADGNVIRRFDKVSGEYIDDFIDYFSLEDIGDTLFLPSGDLLVSSTRYEVIYRFDNSTGSLVGEFSTATELGAVTKLAIDYDGSILAMNSEKVIRLNGADGSFIEDVVVAENGDLFLDMTLDKLGNLALITENQGTRQLKAYGSDGLELLDYFNELSGLIEPNNVVLGPDASFYISDRGADSVVRFNLVTGSTVFNDSSSLLVSPEEITFDENGDLWVAVNAGDKESIIKIERTSGTVSTGNFSGQDLTDIRHLIISGELPQIISHPVTQDIVPGSTASFLVCATGTEALSYQWQKDGVDLPGENKPVLEIAMDESTQPALYSCTVSNYNGSTSSASASLRIAAALVGISSGDTISPEQLALNWVDTQASEYQILVGTTQGANDIEEHLGLTETSLTLADLFFNGQQIWIRLRAFDDSEWQEIDYNLTTEIIPHTVSFVADPAMGGFDLPDAQEVVDGADSIAVEAIPLEGYDFVQWDDESTENPRVFSEVREEITATALFAIKTYSVEFVAGENATIAENAIQEVEHGSSTLEVELIPNEGYEFVKWDNESTENPIIVDNIVEPITLTAVVQLKTYSVEFVAGAGGSISGVTPQSVTHGFDASEVEAIASEGYDFIKWSDDVTDNPRTVGNVTLALSLTAEFQLKTYSVEFVAGTGGSISGLTPQSVTHGFDASEVEAIASEGYEFVKWSDDVTDNPRTVENVTSALSLTAEFQLKSYSVRVYSRHWC